MDDRLASRRLTENCVETQRAERRAWRARCVAAREALAPEQYEQYSAAIRHRLGEAFPQLAAQRVAFYWPIRNEPDLRPLMAAWQSAGQPGFLALLPVATGPERPLVFRAWTPDCAMGVDHYGVSVPVAGTSVTPEALLIPVNAFDAHGYRLGYGGGFFDRTLAGLAGLRPAPLAIGVGFELSRLATVHPQAHDIRLDAVVTEAGVHRSR